MHVLSCYQYSLLKQVFLSVSRWQKHRFNIKMWKHISRFHLCNVLYVVFLLCKVLKHFCLLVVLCCFRRCQIRNCLALSHRLNNDLQLLHTWMLSKTWLHFISGLFIFSCTFKQGEQWFLFFFKLLPNNTFSSSRHQSRFGAWLVLWFVFTHYLVLYFNYFTLCFVCFSQSLSVCVLNKT